MRISLYINKQLADIDQFETFIDNEFFLPNNNLEVTLNLNLKR